MGGYYLPPGTHLMLSINEVHRDPRWWEDPLAFRPERFLLTAHPQPQHPPQQHAAAAVDDQQGEGGLPQPPPGLFSGKSHLSSAKGVEVRKKDSAWLLRVSCWQEIESERDWADIGYRAIRK